MPRLIDALWSTAPPRTARKNLQAYLSELRKRVGDRITFDGWGYSFRAAEAELDALELRRMAGAGRRAVREGDLVEASAVLGGAIRLWRDQPLVEFADVPMIEEHVRGLTELYLSAYEDWAELEIGHGRPERALRGLDDLVMNHPTRERIVGARMTALVQCGRLSEALSQYDDLRRRLATDFGVDPSQALTNLYRGILRGTGRPSTTGAGWPPAGRETAVWPANNLPRGIADFVGRHEELRRIVRENTAVTIITGGPGTGKTTLAVHAGHQLSAAFRDGVLMATFRRGRATRSATDVQREILDAAGVPVSADQGDAATGSRWRSWLADRRILLLVDDAPDEAAVRALLPGTPGSRVLVTSRSRLSGLESVVRIRLGELSEPEGISFLTMLFDAEAVRSDPVAVEAILRRCGRVPLALRVLGGRFADLPHVTLADIAARLGSTTDPLDELVAGDVSFKQRYEQWYGDLSQYHRDTLLQLGALDAPQFSREDLVAVLGGDVGAAERIIERAIESNMATVVQAEVTAHSTCYALSPLTHAFAASLVARRALGAQG
ncbi:AfsR/SARP family transcriptional regulator [Virgisporangium ochraceum]|uniref:AfsR/SARP family transcriptional regulator n=1 Tax=Virgisporangium ochraceum TaxID=65505 RepID=UPI001940F2D8|nr:BTAD domain-containing putative transcriptional regulator [Virgisporangium ochraceum]